MSQGAQRRASREAADALQRGQQGFLHGLLCELHVAQLRERIADQVGAVALDLGEPGIGHAMGKRIEE